MSNFAFLAAEWSHLHQDATKAERYVHTDPRTSCVYARRVLELAVNWMYKYDQTLKLPYQDNLNALLHAPCFQQTLGQALFTKAKIIKELGNLAVHGTRQISGKDSMAVLRELFHVCYWLARTYGKKARPDPGLQFAPPAIPPAADSELKKTQVQLLALEQKLREKDQALSEVLANASAKSLDTDQELQTNWHW